ncbi:MAG: hypothetical protein IIW10_05010, partial [Spirochaetaceae bacterium]|nr:hypothetical protein [Spirochaetaceae bacterium]
VKDFNASGEVVTDFSLMTNADTLRYVTKDLNLSETNPFTGKKLTKRRKSGDSVVELESIYANTWDARLCRDKTTFENSGPSYIVKDNIFREENWIEKE